MPDRHDSHPFSVYVRPDGKSAATRRNAQVVEHDLRNAERRAEFHEDPEAMHNDRIALALKAFYAKQAR